MKWVIVHPEARDAMQDNPFVRDVRLLSEFTPWWARWLVWLLWRKWTLGWLLQRYYPNPFKTIMALLDTPPKKEPKE